MAYTIRYLVTKLLKPLLGCEVSSLRLLNAEALCLICPLSYGILRLLRVQRNLNLRGQQAEEKSDQQSDPDDPTIMLDAHSALNIALFSPLFFFSALYYTDVISTLFVLLAYRTYLKRRENPGSLSSNLSTIIYGVSALFFRQTNIFWVAVFPAGLAVVDALKANAQPLTETNPNEATSLLQSSWNEGVVHDCAVADAGPQGK